MGNCLSSESDEIRRIRDASKENEKREWEERYADFSREVKRLYTPEVQRNAIWQDSNAKTVTVFSVIRFRRLECEDFMDTFNKREKKPRLYKKIDRRRTLDIYYKIS